MGRRTSWWERHVFLGDTLIAAVAAFIALTWTGALGADNGRPILVAWGFLTAIAPLLLRRRAPDVLAAIVGIGCLGQLVLTSTPLPTNIAVLIAVHAVARFGRVPTRRWWLVAAVVGSALAAFDWIPPRGDGEEWAARAVVFGVCAASSATAYFVGVTARQRHDVLVAAEQRAEALERERSSSARLAVQEERNRVAREMHDIVAHSLSVIVVQADGAAYVAQHGDPAARAEAVARSLATISETARSALAETRNLVGALREPEEAAELAPAPTLAQLPTLVERARAGGVDITLEDRSRHQQLPQATESAVFRVAQEALTNALKHAGPGAAITVTLDDAPRGLALAVRDDGRGHQGDDGRGHGLIGMRERVSSVGGTFVARNRMGGGFEVLATFPAGTGGQG